MHRALYRLLRAFTDERRTIEAVNESLRAARLRALPHGDDLLDFVRAYLVPWITGGVAPQMIATLLDDLQAEIDHEKVENGDNTSVSRMAVNTRMPAASVAGMQVPAAHDADFRAPRVPRGIEPVPRTPRRPDANGIKNPAVVVFDPDRFARAALARTLVQGRCDVRVLDSADDVVATIEGPDVVHAVVLEIAETDVEPILRSIAARRPRLPVLVWTASPRAVAEQVLAATGIKRFEVAPKSSRNADLLDMLCQLVND